MELGAWTEADAALARLDLDTPEGRRLLARGLKREPVAWIPLLRAHAAAAFPHLYAEAWGASLASQRSEAVRASVHHPFIDELEPSTEELQQLLLHRVRLLASEGRTARARRLGERVLPGMEAEWAVMLRLDLAVLAFEDGEPWSASSQASSSRSAWARAVG